MAKTVGRPVFRPTIEHRQTVEQMKFCGEAEHVIARALSIDTKTLRKHFHEELADGHAQRRKEVIGLLFEAARDKNVAAIKRLEEMGRLTAAANNVKAREPKLGKKAERQIAAERVGEKFAPPAPPKLVVDNR